MDKSVHEILLIDDDAEDAELTIFALRKSHLAYPIVHIDDGEKALEFLFGAGERPSLILLDLKMPRVDGIQILRKLKGDPEKKKIPVIAMLSSKEGKHYLESFAVKADSYIIKPVDHKQFLAAVAELGIESMILDAS
jgi:two-component system response regulator